MDCNAYPSLPKLCVLNARLSQQNGRVTAWVAERETNFERLRSATASDDRLAMLDAVEAILSDPRHKTHRSLLRSGDKLREALSTRLAPAAVRRRLAEAMLCECRRSLQASHGRTAA
ncbi:hypothetical protein [Adhaeretor mobilis]|uniref:Uncharacterized protein n=1 Tax=Adhaeretor mobilis TaxID=1930276 RepID=A0A517MY48_9BACT|nr:hypothetical protein [Adhaeretor mobilis]QDS99737.1 hypothetical protein HG15A2_30670 [Adhaeretor mobilis]